MSKQEVFDILYEVMETLPRELILLIHKYVLFLPIILESEYKLPKEYCLKKIVILTPNRFVLYDSINAPRIWENSQIRHLFQPKFHASIHDIVRKSDNSFLMAHEDVLDEITIEPFKRNTIRTFYHCGVARKILIDKDGDIVICGCEGVYIIRGTEIISHHSPHMYDICLSNSFKIHTRDGKIIYELRKKANGIYKIYQIRPDKYIEHAVLDNLKIRTSNFNHYVIYEDAGIYTEVYVWDNITDLKVFGDKVYVRCGESIKIYQSGLFVHRSVS